MRAFPVSAHFGRILAAAAIIVLLLPVSLTVVPVSASSPSAPGDLTATAADTGQVILKWTDHSTDESAFQIERATDTYFIDFKVSFAVPSNLNTFSDNSITASTTYYYRVFAINSDGASPASNTATVTSPSQLAFPAGPADLSFKLPAVGQVSLTWKDRSSNEDGFRLERAGNDVFTQGLTTFNVSSGTVAFTDKNLFPLTTYFYRVIAYNPAGDSPPSNTVSVKTMDSVPAAPTYLDAASPEARKVVLRWVDNSANEAGFQIERATDANFSQNVLLFTAEANTDAGAPLVTAIDGQVPAGTFYFRVKSFNASGDSSPSNAAQVIVSDKYEDQLPTWEMGLVEMLFPGFGLVGRRVKVDSTGALFDNLDEPMGQDLTLEMTDKSGSIVIPKAIKVLNANGHALTIISYDNPTISPEPPDNKVIINAFNFGPAGAHFSNPVTLHLRYNPEDLQERTSPEDLKLALWDGTTWKDLAAQLKADQNELIYKGSQLGEFAILGDTSDMSAKFSISNLYIFPSTAQEGEPVYITAKVANTGFSKGEYAVSLTINDVAEGTQSIPLEPQSSTDIKFTCSNKLAGRYQVNINGLKGFFVVKAPLKTVTPSPTPTPTQTTPPITTVSPSATAPIPTFTPVNPFNNVLIFAIIGSSVLIIIVAIGIFLVKK